MNPSLLNKLQLQNPLVKDLSFDQLNQFIFILPCYWVRWFQLTRIERACAMAGLHVLRLMPELTAVILLYAQQQQMTSHDSMGR
ncbi:hypothetical protein F2Q70_00020839 [Brassica cretica]|uniref:Uncharacterized protein n=1 Tax=Brassica cretica TaxID=69181 RepID=A0A8S9GSB0_BRACR|nr:hypothetical protein F2Q70_00020839 [Brassica cretica]